MKWLGLLFVPIVFALSFCGRYSKMEIEAKNYVDSLAITTHILELSS